LDADHVAHLGYAFRSVTPKVPAATVQSEVFRALSEWSKYANLAFQPVADVNAARSVTISFVSGAHGDAYPFDGPGGILAHTFYPVPINAESIAGDVHLDADEDWHAGADLDIYSVVLHEAGHAIGLAHSDKPGDVMYPYYRSHMSLSANDIGAAQALYGAAVTVASPISATPPVGATTPAASTPASTPVPTAALPSLPVLSLDAVPNSVPTSGINVGGTITTATGGVRIQWQTDHGYSGTAAVTLVPNTSGTGSFGTWSTGAVPLAGGPNILTITAFDSVGQSVSKATSVSCSPVSAASTTSPAIPISVIVTTPSTQVLTVNAASLTVAGKASGGTGIARVTWQTAAGASGTASGLGSWVAPGIPLLTGTNTILVRAWDGKGATAWATVVAVRP
jgi:hypothetical protein